LKILIARYCLDFQLKSYILEEQTTLTMSVTLQNIYGHWAIFVSVNFRYSCRTGDILEIVS